jgi:hypothetical protein
MKKNIDFLNKIVHLLNLKLSEYEKGFSVCSFVIYLFYVQVPKIY